MASPFQMWPGPEVKRKRQLPGGLTGNALVSGVVAAIVAGVISFWVAHYQDQDAARQARAAQQAAAATQLEASATTYYNDTFAIYDHGFCRGLNKNMPICLTAAPSMTIYFADEATFDADRLNVSDAKVSALALQMTAYSNGATLPVTAATATLAGHNFVEMKTAYQQLVSLCGQIIQGQQ